MQQVITFQIVKSIRAMHLMIQPHHSRSKSIFPIQCIEFSKQFGWAPTREVFGPDAEQNITYKKEMMKKRGETGRKCKCFDGPCFPCCLVECSCKCYKVTCCRCWTRPWCPWCKVRANKGGYFCSGFSTFCSLSLVLIATIFLANLPEFLLNEAGYRQYEISYGTVKNQADIP